VDVRQQDDDLHPRFLEVDKLVRGQEMAEVEHARGFVADVGPLALGLGREVADLLVGDDLLGVSRQ